MPQYYPPAVKATVSDVSSRRREGDMDSDHSLSLTDALAHGHLAILGLSLPAMHHQQTYTPLLPAIPFFRRARQSDGADTMTFTEVQQPSVPTRISAHHSSFVSQADRRRILLVTTTNEEEHQGAEDVADDIVIVDWRRNILGVLRDVSRTLDEDEDEDWTE